MKCPASKDGVCRNKYALGARCDGYSDSCNLRSEYEWAARVVANMADLARRVLGLKPNGRV